MMGAFLVPMKSMIFWGYIMNPLSKALLGFLAASGAALALPMQAWATSTISCSSLPLNDEGQVFSLRYNVGYGLPTWVFAGISLSDESISSGGPSELDPTTYSVTGFFWDEYETRMEIRDDLGVRVLLLKSSKRDDVEAGVVEFGGRAFAVTCGQSG